MARSSYRSAVILLLIWAIATAVDMGKPFHIDDAFHMEMAQWVEMHPGRPMSGTINWGSGLVPMHTANQPPGFFYPMALVGHFFGYTTTSMHLMRSLFSLLAIVCFYHLARWRSPDHARLLSAVFALGPAFLVNQGVMLDVPLLSLQLLFFDLLVVPRAASPLARYAMAAFVLSGAMFIKYSTVPLLVLFPAVLFLRKEYRFLPIAAIPWVLLVGWGYWNIREFGTVHLFERDAEGFAWYVPFQRFGAMVTTIGAMAPFAPLFLGLLRPGLVKRTGTVLIGLALGVLALGTGVAFAVVPVNVSDTVLLVVFSLSGALLLVSVFRRWPASGAADAADHWTLVGWAGSLVLFIALFSPFMATRHVLLVLPPILLLGAPVLDRVHVRIRLSAVGITALLGFLLTFADIGYARFYSVNAARIGREMAGHGRLWSVGHWGWQWYSRKAGMLIWPDDPGAEGAVAVGDILVRAEGIHGQAVNPDVRLYALFRWKEPQPWWTVLYVGRFAGLYLSDPGVLPWCFDRTQRNVITAYRVTAVPLCINP